MLSSEGSCSDCKLELIKRNWTKLMLKWINRCVYDRSQETRIRSLSPKCLSDIMTKYKHDVCEDDIDRAMLCTDDMEPFIKYKYPILRLRYLTEEEDVPKKLYLMASMLIFHCCVKSRSGVVHEDICNQLSKYEQELIVMFCERLSDMETTINNVEVAIQDAFKIVIKKDCTDSCESSFNVVEIKQSSDTAAHMSSTSSNKSSITTLSSDATVVNPGSIIAMKLPPIKFKSSITVLPSVVADNSSYSDMLIYSDVQVAEKDMYVNSDEINIYNQNASKDRDKSDLQRDKRGKDDYLKYDRDTNRTQISKYAFDKKDDGMHKKSQRQISKDHEGAALNDDNHDVQASDSKDRRCVEKCSCTKCTAKGPCCGEPGSTIKAYDCTHGLDDSSQPAKPSGAPMSRKTTSLVVSVVMFFVVLVALTSIVKLMIKRKQPKETIMGEKIIEKRSVPQNTWQCKNNLCQKAYQAGNKNTYASYSRCSLICMGPQIWPLPIGKSVFSKKIVTLQTNKLEYKLQTVTSDGVHRHLAEAFKLFIGDLAKLEKSGPKHLEKINKNVDLGVKKMNIQIEVESDPDPRMRLNTEESYHINLETIESQVVIKISSSSFCGVRHGLETLTQMILLDENTGNLITLSKANIRDAPSYKHRGLMIDTGRNFIPVHDLLRTIDAMSTVKLNTFHWRISDVTSFPLFLAKIPQLFEYGAYDRYMIYNKNDVETIVKRAGVRGIRVLIEVAAPGPVGRAWSWNPGAFCRSRDNDSCSNVLCMKLDTQDSVLDALQTLYEEIIEMTRVDDVFHLSNSVFSLNNCIKLMDNRDGFLDKALDRLKLANKGFLPKLPIIWYTTQLRKDFEANTWERFGVQLNDWKQSSSDMFLSKFKVIHSSKWDLSCEMKKQRCQKYRNWQEMYSWKSWRNVEAFTVEGGEAILWTDFVDSSNLDYHLWPRTAAVAERLWSDIVANTSADRAVYLRLNSHRSRMLQAGVKVQAIWPAWCTYNPGPCLDKIA